MNIWGNMQEEMEKVMLEYAPGIPLYLEDSRRGGLHGCYTHAESIRLFLPTILETWEERKGDEFFSSPVEFAWVVFSHEIGHHIDYHKTMGYKHLKKSEDKMIEHTLSKKINKLKGSFRIWFHERNEMERRAWREGYKIIPSTYNMDLVKTYENECLQTYETAWRMEYRKQLLVLNIIQKVKQANITIMFWDYYDNIFHYEKDKKTLYINSSSLVTRPKTITEKETTTTKELLYWISYYDSLVQKQQLA